MKKAYKIGNLYAKHILELDNEVKHFKGGSFKSFFKGLKKGFHKVAPIASTVATLTGNPEIGLAVEGTDALLGNGANNELSPEILEYLGGTMAQDAEYKRLDAIAKKYTGKNLDEIDEKVVMGQKEPVELKIKEIKKLVGF